MDNALISVIVTSYNHAEYLDQRMESLLRQTYPDLEIIVVDDCSTDNSLAVLEKYKKDPRVRIIALTANGGYARASNLGVTLSRGEYVMLAECDDYNEPSHIAVLHDMLAADDRAGIAYCRSRLVDGSGRTLGNDFLTREKAFKALCAGNAFIPKRAMQRFLLIACVIPNMSAALIRKSCFNRVKGLSPDYKACADWDFWCRCSLEGDFYYAAACLNNFRTHAASVRSTSGIEQPLTEIMDILFAAGKRIDLSGWERFRFRLNIGYIWASYAPGRWPAWRKSFPAIWRRALNHDRMGGFFLLLGAMKNIAVSIKAKFRRGSIDGSQPMDGMLKTGGQI